MRDGSRVVAGVHGLTWGGCCELLTLWVDPEHRGTGLATRLVQRAEQRARDRDCGQVVLLTHAAAPPALYLNLGYQVVGHVSGYPAGASAYWLRKHLADAVP